MIATGLIFLSSIAIARTWHVDATATPPNDSIQAGIDAASSGDVVVVASGTYYENITMKNGVSVIGSGYATTIIDGGGDTNNFVVRCIDITDTNTRLAGFTLTNAVIGVWCDNSNLRIVSNYITNMHYGTYSPQGSGIFVDSNSSPEIISNVIFDIGGSGIVADNSSEPRIINNTIFNYRTYAGISFASTTVGTVTPVILNNIIYRGNSEQVGGIAWNVDAGATPAIFYNNVFDPGTVVLSSPNYYFYQQGGTWHNGAGNTGSIMSDPNFINSTGDVHLQIGSPCIDTGDPNPPYTDRVDSSRNDMGAYGGPYGEIIDIDYDGVPDYDDNCIFTHNPLQDDTDFDLVGNLCDNCPDVSNPDQADNDSDGIGDACIPDIDVGYTDTPPIIDGIWNSHFNEWINAGMQPLYINVPDEPNPILGNLGFMHDGTNLYGMVLLPGTFIDDTSNIIISFYDGDIDKVGDDVISVNYLASGFRDQHWLTGGEFFGLDGLLNGSGVLGVDGYSLFEFSHPLNSGDSQDFALALPGHPTLSDNIKYALRVFIYQSSGSDFTYYPSAGFNDTDNYGTLNILPCTDTDGDTICDEYDNCLNVSNIDQADDDQDGIGNACDTDLDNDNDLNGSDNCQNIFNPEQEDSDGDGVGDVCDNCPSVYNFGQSDDDSDLLGDACDEGNNIDNEIQPFPSGNHFAPGYPFPVTTEIVNYTEESIQIIKPDCYNTYWTLEGAGHLCRKGSAYGIPADLITLGPGERFPVTCDLNDMFASFPPLGTQSLQIVYTNAIQDPDHVNDPDNCCEDPDRDGWCDNIAGNEDKVPCYTIWRGSIESQAMDILIENGIPVTIDIKPGNDDNNVNLGSKGSIPICIFSTEGFDATTIDPGTVTLAGAGVKVKGKGNRYMSSIDDINEDGLPDLMVHVITQALEITEKRELASLFGKTFAGVNITGSDYVTVVKFD